MDSGFRIWGTYVPKRLFPSTLILFAASAQKSLILFLCFEHFQVGLGSLRSIAVQFFHSCVCTICNPIRMAGGSKVKEQDGYVPPWRQPAPKKEKFDNLKMKTVREPGKGSTMHAPAAARKKGGLPTLDDAKPSMFEFDEDLTLAFSRNFQFVRRALSLDTLLLPLPPHVAGSVARNVGFFTRIFTQFFDPKGIEGARESMGLGLERGRRKVKD
ncbi:hypothetical protein M758_1G075500 [Ceratodon purpureus]|nr:hypothetical protein M758_1G075500 [Ceratodon purpureus]